MDRLANAAVGWINRQGSEGEHAKERQKTAGAPFQCVDPLAVIPSLKGIRTTYTVASDGMKVCGTLGMAAMRAGAITEADLEDGKNAESILVDSISRRVFEAWGAEDHAATVSVNFVDPDLGFDYENTEGYSAYVSLELGGNNVIQVIKPLVYELEGQLTGLGECLFYCLELGFLASVGSYTPASALETACHLEWSGLDSELDYIQEYELDPEEIQYLYTREEFDRNFPEWMTSQKNQSFYDEILDSALRYGIGDPEVILLAKSILSLWKNVDLSATVGFRKTENKFYIRSSHKDSLFRFSDNMENHNMEAGEGGSYDCVWGLAAEKGHIQKWLSELKGQFALFRKSIRLMSLITEEGVYSNGYHQ